MLGADFRTELDYTLNAELHAGERPPSGVQGQAFQLAMQKLALPYGRKKAKLVAREAGLNLSPFEGLSRGWQVGIQNLMNFLDEAFKKLDMRAAAFARNALRDAGTHGTASQRWNEWSAAALQNYADAVHAFSVMVKLAVRGAPMPARVPPQFSELAKSAGMDPPTFAAASKTLQGLDDLSPGTLFGVLVTAGVAGLGWWYAKRAVER